MQLAAHSWGKEVIRLCAWGGLCAFGRRVAAAEAQNRKAARTKEELPLPTGLLIEPLATFSERAARALDEYVAVHDEFFRFSFRRVLPLPAMFAGIDFEACAAGLEAVSQELADVQEQLASFRTTNPPEHVVEPFLSRLEQYLPALSRSTQLLRAMALRLAEKAQRTRAYSWSEYRRDLRQYRASVDHYVRMGADDNRALAGSSN